MTKTLTPAEVLAFISAQPAERPVDMRQNCVDSPDKCGCLLIHFHRSHFPDDTRIDAGYYRTYGRNEITIHCSNADFLHGQSVTDLIRCTTYGQLRIQIGV